jgi:hypothetical protein
LNQALGEVKSAASVAGVDYVTNPTVPYGDPAAFDDVTWTNPSYVADGNPANAATVTLTPNQLSYVLRSTNADFASLDSIIPSGALIYSVVLGCHFRTTPAANVGAAWLYPEWDGNPTNYVNWTAPESRVKPYGEGQELFGTGYTGFEQAHKIMTNEVINVPKGPGQAGWDIDAVKALRARFAIQNNAVTNMACSAYDIWYQIGYEADGVYGLVVYDDDGVVKLNTSTELVYRYMTTITILASELSGSIEFGGAKVIDFTGLKYFGDTSVFAVGINITGDYPHRIFDVIVAREEKKIYIEFGSVSSSYKTLGDTAVIVYGTGSYIE